MAEYRTDAKHVNVDVAATTAAGTLIQIGTRVGIVDPKPDGQPWMAGDKGVATIRGEVRIKNSGISFAYGADVGYDASTDEAVAGGTGDFNAGICVEAVTGSDPWVRVVIG